MRDLEDLLSPEAVWPQTAGTAEASLKCALPIAEIGYARPLRAITPDAQHRWAQHVCTGRLRIHGVQARSSVLRVSLRAGVEHLLLKMTDTA